MEEASNAAVKAKRKYRAIYLLVPLVLAAAIFGALEWRKHAINSQVQTALVDEAGATTTVYRRDLLGGNDIVFDIQAVSGDMSMVIMTRRLLKTAEALKDADLGRVFLAYKGHEKFYLDGAYFKQIGAERQTQNAIYTIRTMPENVHNVDGSPAFQTWSGGILGVLGQQMDDVNEFHRKWWADDAVNDLGK